jgi:hypothetical protein
LKRQTQSVDMQEHRFRIFTQVFHGPWRATPKP